MLFTKLLLFLFAVSLIPALQCVVNQNPGGHGISLIRPDEISKAYSIASKTLDKIEVKCERFTQALSLSFGVQDNSLWKNNPVDLFNQIRDLYNSLSSRKFPNKSSIDIFLTKCLENLQSKRSKVVANSPTVKSPVKIEKNVFDVLDEVQIQDAHKMAKQMTNRHGKCVEFTDLLSMEAGLEPLLHIKDRLAVVRQRLSLIYRQANTIKSKFRGADTTRFIINCMGVLSIQRDPVFAVQDWNFSALSPAFMLEITQPTRMQDCSKKIQAISAKLESKQAPVIKDFRAVIQALKRHYGQSTQNAHKLLVSTLDFCQNVMMKNFEKNLNTLIDKEFKLLLKRVNS